MSEGQAPTVLDVDLQLRWWVGSSLVVVLFGMIWSSLQKAVVLGAGLGLIIQALGIGLVLSPIAVLVARLWWKVSLAWSSAFRLTASAFLVANMLTFPLDVVWHISVTSPNAYMAILVGASILVPPLVWLNELGLRRALQLASVSWGVAALVIGVMVMRQLAG